MNHAPGTPAGQPGLDALIAVRDARDALLRETIAAGEAERVVNSARMAELTATSKAAVRRHRAAKGLLTRARKDGSAQKIAAAAAREREASAEAGRILEECQAEMRSSSAPGSTAWASSTIRSGRPGTPGQRSPTPSPRPERSAWGSRTRPSNLPGTSNRQSQPPADPVTWP